jgi:hypothetical protein
MKRKQAETNEERPKTRPFAVETVPTLTNIADVLVASVLSFLDYRERSKVRRSCRRLLNSVDSMATPLNLTLSIQLVPENASTEVLQTMRGRTWTTSWDNDRALVEMKFKSSLSVPEFPTLKSIRPTRVQVQSLDSEEGRVDARLVHHLATQTAKTVTQLSVLNLVSSSVIELQDSLAEFDEEGDGVTELHLSTCVPFVHTMSAILRLRKLRSLCISIRREMIAGWEELPESVGLQFAALSALPDLEELTVRGQGFDHEDEVEVMRSEYSAVNGHMLGYSAITNLSKLSSDFLIDSGERDSLHAITTILHRLKNLESLSMLCDPETELWNQVHAAGGHTKLESLSVRCWLPEEPTDLISLAEACKQDFPALRALEIHFKWTIFEFNVNGMVQALASLKAHPSLSTLKCGWEEEDDKGTFFEDCREALGNGIELTEIPFEEGV